LILSLFKLHDTFVNDLMKTEGDWSYKIVKNFMQMLKKIRAEWVHAIII